jgi:cation:H+ antiporter
MDALYPEPLTARAHQAHALSIGFGALLLGVAGLGLIVSPHVPPIGWIGGFSIALIALYFAAMRLVFRHQRKLRATEAREVAEELRYASISRRTALIRYSVAAAVVVGAALLLPSLAAELARQTGLGEAFVGSLFVAITTSLPEIVVSIAAVRLGAIDLGIANVLGSNLFNLFILALDDIFYRGGPLLTAADPSHAVGILAAIAMNALFLIGLTYRVMTKRFAIAWDTGAMAAVYAAAVAFTYLLQAG